MCTMNNYCHGVYLDACTCVCTEQLYYYYYYYYYYFFPPSLSLLYSSGVGRTGVFIALCIVLERYTVEGMIDLFQTVKTLRIQRSAMVQTRVRRKEGIGRERENNTCK